MPETIPPSTGNPANSRASTQSMPFNFGLRAHPGNTNAGHAPIRPRQIRFPGSTGIPKCKISPPAAAIPAGPTSRRSTTALAPATSSTSAPWPIRVSRARAMGASACGQCSAGNKRPVRPATRAAVAEGIVAGGGTALLRCVPVVEALAEKLKGDERNGAEIVARALQKPVRTIAENCGKDGAVVADEVANQKNATYGYDANNDDYVDMFKAGIVDPLRVTRNALQNAASIAGLMLTTEVMVTKIDEDDKKSKVAGAVA